MVDTFSFFGSELNEPVTSGKSLTVFVANDKMEAIK
jgi:hypothetical protein